MGLIMGDSLGVMRDIETVWRAGTLDELRLRHRRAMVEDIVQLRRSMRAVVFLWVRGHAGVYCNAYADTIAKASLDERVEGGQVEQRATLVRYETREGRAGPGGATEWAATSRDRRPLAMTEREVQKWLTVKWRTLKEEEAGGRADGRAGGRAGGRRAGGRT